MSKKPTDASAQPRYRAFFRAGGQLEKMAKTYTAKPNEENARKLRRVASSYVRAAAEFLDSVVEGES